MEAVKTINYIISIVFIVCYTYQFFYILVPYVVKDRRRGEVRGHRYAVLISARNEEAVIGQLLESIKRQSYDGGLVTTFVVADNCTDGTARVAAESGAIVFERFDSANVGKGYALNYLLHRIDELFPERPFDGYFVFDADNVLEENYIEEMNRVFSEGYEIVTSYRNSKNFGDNWISSGYALWFLRESQFLNHARMKLGTSCAVSGTGFLFSQKVLGDCGGWNFHLLTEDIEFTVHNVVRGLKIGYCHDAVLYDEQPTRFRQSWNQRLRWARGYLQVFGKYGKDLLRGIAHGSFSCFDMTMNIMPAAILTFVGVFANGAAAVCGLITGQDVSVVGESLLSMLVNTYLTLIVIGGSATISEWKRIYAPTWKKIVYTLTFPIFMFTYIPISFAALFARRVTWKPIVHSRSASLADIRAAAETLSGRTA